MLEKDKTKSPEKETFAQYIIFSFTSIESWHAYDYQCNLCFTNFSKLKSPIKNIYNRKIQLLDTSESIFKMYVI
jgi:hypothetical protein